MIVWKKITRGDTYRDHAVGVEQSEELGSEAFVLLPVEFDLVGHVSLGIAARVPVVMPLQRQRRLDPHRCLDAPHRTQAGQRERR